MDRGITLKGIYYYNSIFTLETPEHFLVFDYYRADAPERVIPAGMEKSVVVFASHSHGDHYDPCIFDWRRDFPGIRYVLSDDIKIPAALSGGDVTTAEAGGAYDLGDLKVRCLRSTDLGGAFLIETEGLALYHGGDLNWWAWPGETPEYNRKMAERYRAEIDSLNNPEIDAAFVPLDGRLEENAGLGLDYFMKHTRTKWAAPMHFRHDFSVFEKLDQRPETEGYRNRVLRFTGENQPFELPV